LRRTYSRLADVSENELIRLEQLTRGIIDAYCNQTFQFEQNKTITVVGNNTNQLLLPKRIVRLISLRTGPIGSAGVPTSDMTLYSTVADDWSIGRAPVDLNDTKYGFPGGVGALFKGGSAYRVQGDFGWKYVPARITQAAGILVDFYSQPGAKYRETNVDVVRAADWRIEMIKTGDDTTGNANADAILNRFVNPNWAVVI
jgi:hypothetical protein